jgi:hypothetical protein
MISFKLFIWFHDYVFFVVFPLFIIFMIWNKVKTSRASEQEPITILPSTITNAISNWRSRWEHRNDPPAQPSIVDGYVHRRYKTKTGRVLRGSTSPASGGRTVGGSSSAPVSTTTPQVEDHVVYQDEYSDYDYDKGQEREGLIEMNEYSDQYIDQDEHYPIQVTNPQESTSEPPPMYSKSNFVLRVRVPSGTVVNITELDASSALSELLQMLENKTAIPIQEQQSKFAQKFS